MFILQEKQKDHKPHIVPNRPPEPTGNDSIVYRGSYMSAHVLLIY